MKKIFLTFFLSLVLFLLLALSPKNIAKADFDCMTCPTGTYQTGGGYGFCSDSKSESVTCKTGQKCDHKKGCIGEASSQGNCMYCTDGNYQIGGGRGYCPNLDAIAYADCSVSQTCDGKKGCVDKEVPSYGSPSFTCNVCESGNTSQCNGAVLRKEVCDSSKGQSCDHAIGCIQLNKECEPSSSNSGCRDGQLCLPDLNKQKYTCQSANLASQFDQSICGVYGSSCKTALGDISTDSLGFIRRAFGLILSISGGIALLLIIISGYRILSSQGNPEALKGAREQLTAAIVGLLFIIFALVILQVIGYDILGIPAFK